VAHAELGRRPVSAEFWELADATLGADGNLTGWGTRIKELTGTLREEQRRLDQTRHAARVSRFLPPPRRPYRVPCRHPGLRRRLPADALTAISRSHW
jgi:hypothetical protein